MANQGGGGGASGSEVRAGGAFVEIFGKDRLSKMLDGMKGKATSFASSLKSIGTGIGILGGAMLAPLTALLGSGVNKAVEIDKMAESLGFTREEMQKLAYAAEVAGVSIDEVIENQARYQDLIANAPTLDNKTIDAAVTSQREFNKAWIEARNAITPLITLFAPMIQGLGRIIKENAGLLQIVFAVGAGLTGLGIAFVTAGSIISGVVTVFSAMGTVLGVVGSAVGLMLTPFGILVLAIGAGVAAFLLFTETGKMLTTSIGIAFGEMFGILTDTLGGIVAALTKGDLQQAWNVFKAGGIAAFKMLEAGATYAWVGIKNVIINSLKESLNWLDNFTIKATAKLMKLAPGWMKGGMTDEEVDKASNDLVAENNAALAADLAKAKAFRDKQIADANKEFDDAKKKLGQEVAKAKEPMKVGKEGFDHPPPAMIAAVRGAFRTLGDQRQFGMGDTIPQKQLAEQKKQVEILDGIFEQMVKLNKNLAFK